MILPYKTVSIIYGGNGKKYAEKLNDRIIKLSQEDRYPIQSQIVMESFLTEELLADVVGLFKKSELCVVFLTADDEVVSCGNKKRLRQNVVFELGMALVQLGRERCILLSDFDIRDNQYELPSDMNSLEIRQFDPANIDKVIEEVLVKILKESKNSILTGQKADSIPQYNNLLTRETYYIDYENLFGNNWTSTEQVFGILKVWEKECKSFTHFDEKCIYLLERLNFLPMLGNDEENIAFLKHIKPLIMRVPEAEIEYYKSKPLIEFAKMLVRNVIEYTSIKLDKKIINKQEAYEACLEEMMDNKPPRKVSCNPLLSVVYYDYIGLLNMKLYDSTKEETYIIAAQKAYLKALKYVDLVDMNMQIWAGFIQYNAARVYARMENVAKAEPMFKKAIRTRAGWLRVTDFNVKVRNALSSEYFISKMSYLAMRDKEQLLPPEEVSSEYEKIELELSAYSDVGNGMDPLTHIRKELTERIRKHNKRSEK